MASTTLPPLRHIQRTSLSQLSPPVTHIRTEDDVEGWKRSRGYQDYGLFLRRLSQSVLGYDLPYDAGNASEAVLQTMAMLEELDGWIDEIPALSTPQRFGNLAFRTWGKRLEDNASRLLAKLLPDDLQSAADMVSPYLLTSFGSFSRMDYGTGHETSFLLFLCALTLARFYNCTPEEERCLSLVIFERYLRLCWRLHDVYQLEPAGSHGVWGLDDYTFISYILGSGQLRGHPEIPIDSVLQKSPLPQSNLYFMSINRIKEVKRGPFHEHSPQLHSIAVGVRTWDKVNSGLFKMYEAEVLSKRVVVQHLHLGGLLEWDTHPSKPPTQSVSQSGNTSTAVPQAPTAVRVTSALTGAPWATALPSNSGGIPPMTAPWSSTAVPRSPP